MKQAEAALKQYAQQPGFTISLLKVTSCLVLATTVYKRAAQETR